jgi:hypothetical protein
MTDMPSGKEPEPGYFARAVSDEIIVAMTRHRVSGTHRRCSPLGKPRVAASNHAKKSPRRFWRGLFCFGLGFQCAGERGLYHCGGAEVSVGDEVPICFGGCDDGFVA